MYRENGKPVDTPRQHFYSSEAFADRLVQYLDETRGDGRQPFFAYLAFTAPHWPLHAKDEDIAKYEGRYEQGYEALQAERFERQKKLGLVPAGSRLYKGHPKWPAWQQLTPAQQKSEARRMAVYAAMVDNMDRQIGRVLDHLQKTGELDNTVVVFLSDNGADGNSVYDVARTREWVHQAMDNSTPNVGRPGSFVEYGPGWAQVGMTPFNLYKSFMYEGGISVPAIVWGPRQGVQAQRKAQVGHVMDIAPTLYELAGATHPAAQAREAQDTVAKGAETRHDAPGVLPVKGRSLLAFLQGRTSSAYSPDDAIGWELGGRKALRKGDWKIVYANAPWGKDTWELYNLAEDRTEQNDLAASHPAKLAELLADWRRYVADNGVLEIPGLATRPGYSNGARYYDDLAIEAAQQPRAK
jgi:arylsulfatase